MKQVRQVFITAVVCALAGLLFAGGAFAEQASFTFDIELATIEEDSSLSGTLGEDNWYQWIYKVDVIPGGDRHNALSHFTLELADCYDQEFLDVIAGTTGANGLSPNAPNLASLEGDTLRLYEEVETGFDSTTSLSGVKWNADESSPDFLDEIGEYDYFWFSAPTNLSQLGTAAVKHGSGNAFAEVEIPECPGCHSVPEPASVMLFGSGMAGLAAVRRKKEV